MINVRPDEVKLFSSFIYNLTGIVIDSSKSYLLETRFGKLLLEEKCQSFTEFYNKIKSGTNALLEKKVIDAITTNETLFFRDTQPFDLLKHKILPELIDIRSKGNTSGRPIPINIWSAACSTGQEVYSIAITLKELQLDPKKYQIKLIGTDISDAAISQASYGSYNKFEIERGLAKDRLMKYFEPKGSNWKIKDEIRAMATFKRINLLKSLTIMGRWDIIFCRNVAIYFSIDDRKHLFNNLSQVLEKDGYLIIGSTESLTGICPQFLPKQYLKSIYYQKK